MIRARRHLCLLCAACMLATVLGAQPHHPLVEQYRFGSFAGAARIAVDPFGKVLVSDAAQHIVYRFRLDGTMETKTGGQGWENNQFDHPAGMDAHLGIVVYVADERNNRIVRLDRDLNFIGSFSTPESTPPAMAFGYPRDVVLSKMENLYILDGENGRIAATTGLTSIDNIIGGVDAGRGALHAPIAMCMNTDDRLYVLEKNRVVVFDTFGNFLFDFGRGTLASAVGLTAGRNGIFVVDGGGIKKFRFDGTVDELWSLKECFFAEPAMELRDIAVSGASLLLLTTKNIIVMQ
jgi:hypothetical protein